MSQFANFESLFNMRRRGIGILSRSAVALAAAAVLVTFSSCGVQEHPQAGLAAPPGTGGAVVTPGTGGQVAASTGGAPGSGGAPSSSGTGGADVPSTGGVNGTSTGGSVVTGSGGRVSASGGSGGAVVSGTGGAAPMGTGGARPPGTGGVTGTGGAASGVTIMIGGTAVPKEKAIAFIHFGHSNMLGHGEKPSSLRPFFYDPQPGLWIYRGNNAFVAAMEPTAPSSTRDSGAGPGMALLKTAAAAAPADHHFISIGRGQGSAPSTDYVKGALLYPTVMTRAMELKGKVTFGAIFVMLGITERHLPAAQQPGFPMRIQQIIASMRADLGEPNLPVLFCDYEMEATATLAPTGPVGTAMIPMIRSLPGLVSNLELVPTQMLGMEDDHHFDMNGQKVWSERAIGIMQTKGWFPWRR